MPTYSYQGKQYKLTETDPALALARIKQHISTSTPDRRAWLDHAASLTPPVLGAVGGLLGGMAGIPAGPPGIFAGAVGGAALGGMAGTMSKNAATGDSSSVAMGGIEQGAYEAAGGALAKGAKWLGKPLMQWVMKSTPEVAQTMLREGVAATRGGLLKLADKMGKAGAETRAIADNATRSGYAYDAYTIAKDVIDKLVPDIQNHTLAVRDERILKKLTGDFIKSHAGSPITPTKLLGIKQSSDHAAKTIYSAIEAKRPVKSVTQFTALWHKTMADHARELLNGIQDPITGQWNGGIPGMAEANSYTSELIKAHQTLAPLLRRGGGFSRAITRRSLPVLAGGTIGALEPAEDYNSRILHSAVGATAGAALSSPEALSTLALLLRTPAAAATLRQVPRGIGAAVTYK